MKIFWIFLPKGGGGLANSEISLSEKSGASKLLEGGGGVSEFWSFSKEKKTVFFIDASPKGKTLHCNTDKFSENF